MVAKTFRGPGIAGPTLLKQTAVSVAATLIATGVLTGFRAEWTAWHPQAPVPALTSGGKFAARVDALASEARARDPLALPTPEVPSLAAALLPPPAAAFDTGETPAAQPVPDQAAKPVRHVASHAEPKRRVAIAPALDVMPPRRSETLVTLAAAPEASAVEAEAVHTDVWSTTKALAHQALWLGGSVLDSVNPVRLLP